MTEFWLLVEQARADASMAAPTVWPSGSAVGAALASGLVWVPRMLRSLWRKGSPMLRAAAQAGVDPANGISYENGRGRGRLPWSGVHSVLETERLFLIEITDRRTRPPFLILVKRGLPDPARITDLRAVLVAGTAGAKQRA